VPVLLSGVSGCAVCGVVERGVGRAVTSENSSVVLRPALRVACVYTFGVHLREACRALGSGGFWVTDLPLSVTGRRRPEPQPSAGDALAWPPWQSGSLTPRRSNNPLLPWFHRKINQKHRFPVCSQLFS
jgi:hypothetical protein